MKGVALTKYEGAGNDFLVLLDPHARLVPSPELARALCERHHGIGADGLLHLRPLADGASISMALLNADGSPAETSGNGLRCAVLAALDEGLVAGSEVTVQTSVAVVRCEVLESAGPGSATIRVEMGTVQIQKADEFPFLGAQAFAVDVGNPHLVVIGSNFEGVDLAALGPGLSAAVEGGRNVELITPGPEHDAISLKVYERGVGITDACGTGSCAGAAVARAIGAVAEHVLVHNPGGPLTVDLAGELFSPSASLSGPTRRIARLVIELEDFALDEKALFGR